MAYFLGIDLGTSAVKTVLVDDEGEVISKSRQGYPIYSPEPDWAEQDPEQWWEAATKAIDTVIRQAHIDPAQIQGIGLSGQTHGTVMLDENLRPLRPAIIWMDRRSVSQVQHLQDEQGVKLYQISGIPISPGFMAPSLLWVRENEPSLWNRVHKVLLPKDYIRLKLTGVVATDVSDAGGTLLLDTANRRWSEQILEELEIPPELLPPAYECCQVTGEVIQATAERASLRPGTPVCAGGADQVMGAVGNGVVRAGVGASIIGTGGQLLVSADEPRIEPERGLHTIPHAVPQKWTIMGAILCAGASLSWFHDQLLAPKETRGLSGLAPLNRRNLTGLGGTEDSYQSLFKEASAVLVGSEGLVFLPYLKGERTPHLDPYARGAFVGLTLRHTRGHLIRAVMEGVGFALRDCLEAFKQGVNLSYIVSSGGGGSQLWRQIQADIFNLPAVSLNTEEQSAYGAALVAAVSTGSFSGVEEACEKWIKVVDELVPNPQNVKIYDRYYQIYRGLYGRLKADFRLLSELSKNPSGH